MKSVITQWTLQELYEKRDRINFPVYQRGLVWSEKEQVLLIDSILRGIDIPKLYLERKSDAGDEAAWEVIDGNQRIQTIIGFFDDEFAYRDLLQSGELAEYDGKFFGQLREPERQVLRQYQLTIVEVTRVSDEEVRLLFQRLQQGMPLNSGELLNSIMGNMREFVILMSTQPFIKNTSITHRRFAKEQVCAQICNNSAFINKTGNFRSSKYDDLENLYRAHRDFDLLSAPAKGIMSVLAKLNEIFGAEASRFTNRASVVSIYLLVEEMINNRTLSGQETTMRSFYLQFLEDLKIEVRKGMAATNRFLVSYEGRVIQAADSRAAVTERHRRLKLAFEYYVKHGETISYEDRSPMFVCSVCHKRAASSIDLARHIMAVSDAEHIGYVESNGLRYPELLGVQDGKISSASFAPLVELLEKQAKESE